MKNISYMVVISSPYYACPLNRDFVYFKALIKYLNYLTGRNITAKTYEELPSYPLYTRNFNDSKLSNCRIYISKLDFNK